MEPLQRAYCKHGLVQKPRAPGTSRFSSHVTSPKHRRTVTYFVSLPLLTGPNRPLLARGVHPTPVLIKKTKKNLHQQWEQGWGFFCLVFFEPL